MRPFTCSEGDLFTMDAGGMETDEWIYEEINDSDFETRLPVDFKDNRNKKRLVSVINNDKHWNTMESVICRSCNRQ
ncbi:unnamed protein product [Peronospora belbahrii]|uniref:Uncharacterized protein n=1 Tax=Peronospora belbahrii TaxID=622444 RepID=A0ABN8CWQ8_9STRA|nr:unnamed protein product [Peronospora belbahrii]